MAARAPVTPQALHIIRLALLLGVLGFGLVAWLRHASATGPVPEEIVPLRWAVIALLVTAAGVSIALRPLIEKAADFNSAATFTLVSWAVAEAPALTAAVHYFLSGKPALFLAATAVFIVVCLLNGVPAQRE